ncbi:hypothetical protein, partial [Nocardia sp. NPDC004722]
RLTLDGREIATELQIDADWTRAATMPQQTKPHPDGGEGVHYPYCFLHHLASARGTIEYIFDVAALRTRTIEHLEIDTSS